MTDEMALNEVYKHLAEENKAHSKRWFIGFLISNIMWALVVVSMVVGFLIWDSQFEYETVETMTQNQTEVTQETTGDGNNVYQAGEHATYNEGGD